jgi:hypothetical protein
VDRDLVLLDHGLDVVPLDLAGLEEEPLTLPVDRGAPPLALGELDGAAQRLPGLVHRGYRVGELGDEQLPFVDTHQEVVHVGVGGALDHDVSPSPGRLALLDDLDPGAVLHRVLHPGLEVLVRPSRVLDGLLEHPLGLPDHEHHLADALVRVPDRDLVVLVAEVHPEPLVAIGAVEGPLHIELDDLLHALSLPDRLLRDHQLQPGLVEGRDQVLRVHHGRSPYLTFYILYVNESSRPFLSDYVRTL